MNGVFFSCDHRSDENEKSVNRDRFCLSIYVAYACGSVYASCCGFDLQIRKAEQRMNSEIIFAERNSLPVPLYCVSPPALARAPLAARSHRSYPHRRLFHRRPPPRRRYIVCAFDPTLLHAYLPLDTLHTCTPIHRYQIHSITPAHVHLFIHHHPTRTVRSRSNGR
jgi:hypothetical protein